MKASDVKEQLGVEELLEREMIGGYGEGDPAAGLCAGVVHSHLEVG